LAAQCALRPGMPLEDAATQLLTGARELLDDVAVGVCRPRPRSAPPPAPAAGRAQTTPSPPLSPPAHAAPPAPRHSSRPGARGAQLVIRLGPTRVSQPFASDPARLFPEFAIERVVSILDEDGSTLHAAADD